MEGWGKELILDLDNCDLGIITSKDFLEQFPIELCHVIEMRPYGEPLVEHFGHNDPKTAGYSVVQLIETSNITAHFSEAWRTAYINIFSCKDFDVDKAAEFCRRYFGQFALVMRKVVLYR